MLKQCKKCLKFKSFEMFHKDKYKKDNKCSWCKECKIISTKEYYNNNREIISKTRNEKYLKHCKEINRKRRKYKDVSGRGQFNKLNPTHFDFGASNRKVFGESSLKRLIRNYKSNAKQRNLSYNLCDEDVRILTKQNCIYCDRKPSQTIKNKDAFGEYLYNGIDRINPALGYSKDNCVTACKWCNKAKGSMSVVEWNDFCYRIAQHWNKPKGGNNG